jgi:nucleoid DNA-binding protein
MNKLELAIAIAADIGMNKTFTYRALIAIQQQLDAEGFAGRAVVWDGFGTFMPRRVVGQRMARVFGGVVFKYDNWKLVVDPALVSQADFVQGAASLADTHPAQMALVLQSYKALVLRALRRGRGVFSKGHGGFQVGRRKARVYYNDDGSVSSRRPARLVIRYHGGALGAHQKFVGLAGLI